MNTIHNNEITSEINTKPQKPASRLERMLYKPGIHLFLFFLFSTIIAWPMLSISNDVGHYWSVFIYLFVVWSILIAILLLVAVCCLKQHSTSQPSPKNEPAE